MTAAPTIRCGAVVPSDHPSIRLDSDYLVWRSHVVDPVPMDQVLEVMSIPGKAARPTPERPFLYCEIGDIDKFGRASPTLIPEVDALGDCEPQERVMLRLNQKVTEERNIVAYDGWHVLVPKTRTNLRKFAIITDQESDPKRYFTTDLIALRPSEDLLSTTGLDRPVATCLLMLMLLGDLGPMLDALSRAGKTYPVLDRRDLEASVADQAVVDRYLKQDAIDRASQLADTLLKMNDLEQQYRQLVATARPLNE